MARPVNRRCLHCATKLSADEARQVHGLEGDGCWHESVCHRRRTHYRHRQQNNEKRQQERRLSRKESPVPDTNAVYEVRLPAPEALAAFLVFVRRNSGSPVHAIGAEVWQQGRLVGRIALQHTMGLRSQEMSTYLVQMQQKLHEGFGIERFEDVFIERQPEDCPIASCPLTTLAGQK